MAESRRPRAPLSVPRRLLFLSLVALTLGGTLEIAARALSFRADERLERRWREIEGSDIAGSGEVVNFGRIIRPSPNPDVIYELVPGLDVRFLRKPMSTNEAGFRGPHHPGPKRPGTVRIVGLGDSVMFGWGVADGETYLEYLAAGLEEQAPHLDWEIVNTAVPGYNTAMEVAVLEEYGLAYEPDLVIINFVGNDFGLPNFIPQQVNYLDLRRSFLVEAITGRLFHSEEVNDEEWRRVFSNAPRPQRRFEWRPDRVPEQYRNHVGRDGYRRAMRRLAELRDEHGFLLIILGHPGVYDIVDELGEELDIPIVTTWDHFQTGIQHNDLDGMRDPSLIVAYNDSHPSRRGHAWIAQVLNSDLRNSGVLLELVKRRATPEVLRHYGLEASDGSTPEESSEK